MKPAILSGGSTPAQGGDLPVLLGLAQRLRDVETYAANQVKRLELEVQTLRNENANLRSGASPSRLPTVTNGAGFGETPKNGVNAPGLNAFMMPATEPSKDPAVLTKEIRFVGRLDINLDWETGQVTNTLQGQAQDAGVQPFWKIRSIDGQPYDQQLLRKKVYSGSAYMVTFDLPDSNHTDAGDMTPRMKERETIRNLRHKSREATRAKSSLAVSTHQPGNMGAGFAANLVRSPTFQNGSLALVVLNAAWIAIDLDFNGEVIAEADPLFQIGEIMFALLFSVEIAFRAAAFKGLLYALVDRWFLFDSFVTVLMVIDIMVGLVARISGGGLISAFRLARLIRLARITRLAQILPELKVLALGIIHGLRAVAVAIIVLMAITYCFAVMLRALSLDTPAEDIFWSVPHSVFILVMQGMGPHNNVLIDELGSAAWYLAVVFALFLFLSAVTIMNMLIGILCEVMGRVSAEAKEETDREKMTTNMKMVLEEIDSNNDGTVSRAEFLAMMDNSEAMKILVDVGVDVFAIVDNVDGIFATEETKLDFDDFMEVMKSYRATKSGLIRSIAGLRHSVRIGFAQIGLQLVDVLDKRNGPVKSAP